MAVPLPDLSGFTGSEQLFRHPLMRHVRYTEGVKHVAWTVGAHWLVDKIAILQACKAFRDQPFQVWTINVVGTTAKITVSDGDGGVFYTEEIVFTDFPEGEFTLWCADLTILLPSEY